MTELAHLAGLIPGLAPAPNVERPPVKESWHPGYNPVTDATAVVDFGAVFLAPGRYLQQATGLLMDANGALKSPDACEECGTEYNARRQIIGADYRYMVRVLKPEHLLVRNKVIYEWTYCRRCLTPEELEAARQLNLMPPAQGQTTKRRRKS